MYAVTLDGVELARFESMTEAYLYIAERDLWRASVLLVRRA